MTRAVADVGRGLEPARPGRAIERGERIHVIGAGGAGASAAVLLGHYAGGSMSGCDPGGASPYTDALAAAGIRLAWEHDPAHVAAGDGARVDRLGVTKSLTSVHPDHPELLAAAEAGVARQMWQQIVADAAASQGGRLVAVAGTHGKSTTTGWLVDMLVRAGRDPGAFVGALMPPALTGGLPATARWGRGDQFVVEADEYAGNFAPFVPALIVLLNADWDHPDVFADETAVIAAFEDWIRAAARDDRRPTLIANVADPAVGRLLRRLADWPGRIVRIQLLDALAASDRPTAGEAPAVTGRVSVGATGTTLEADGMGTAELVRAELRLPGRHFALDALAAAAAAHELEVPPGVIARSLAGFGGVGRRLELKADLGGVLVYDDYGHHPTAIRATMTALRERHPDRRLWAVYEPLTFHRTAAMLDAFADVLATADRVSIADIWANRDPDLTVSSAGALADAVTARGRAPADAPGSVEATAAWLADRVEPGDVVLVMGGGRSYVIADELVAALGSAAARPSGGSSAR